MSNGYEGVALNTINSGKTNDSSPQGIHLTVWRATTTAATGRVYLDGTDDDLESWATKEFPVVLKKHANMDQDCNKETMCTGATKQYQEMDF